MAKAFVLIRTNGGQPDIPQSILGAGPVNYVLCDIRGTSPPVGAYLISAKGSQLVALDALPYALGLVAVTESGARWPELDEEAAEATITKINTWLTNNDIDQQIPLGWTYDRLVRRLFQWFNDRFDLANFDIAGA